MIESPNRKNCSYMAGWYRRQIRLVAHRSQTQPLTMSNGCPIRHRISGRRQRYHKGVPVRGSVGYPVCPSEAALELPAVCQVSSKEFASPIYLKEDDDGQTSDEHDDGLFPPAHLLRRCRRQTRSRSGVYLMEPRCHWLFASNVPSSVWQ